ncbi:shufflon system plasmid conjugative transfer pilus tip adhesin PilV [uncultured Selenomonas sp.]|jgi:hypothetical protein|uniref:shufflon system plasmid conjugative transfer pilus tip adhesin PilV n=1 Tax=uncultured Selenomonas sp. TaxID=159275 RepID=UPI002633BC2E|nr:shufflon system plasmid conjugative transfer pilus tip adhesin PilV [uncultured Selenomonas sp.]
MAQFPKIQLTQLGKNIILAGQNKQKVTFTKVELGDGLLDEQSVDDMTALVHSVMSLPLQNFLNNGDGSARLRFVLDNNNLAKGFFNREIGVFAKIDDGEEQLYAYTNAGNLADYIPGKESPISSKIINLHIIVGNAMNLTIVAENSAYVTKLDMDSHKAAVEIDHPDASVTTPKIRDGAVTSAKIAERAIEKKHLRKGGIVAGDIGAYSKEDVNKLLDDHRKKTPLDHPDGSVTTAKLADGSVTTAKLADKSVTAKQLAVSAGELGAYTKAETDARLNTKAALASPALTGTPTAPTAGRGTNNAQVATTAFVTQAIAALINGSPGALDTLQELAKALGNDADFAATVTNALAGKVAKSGDTMTGRLTAPSVLVNDWFRALGNCGFYFENHGGGWHMTDDEWIRAHNGKGIYTSGKIRCDAGFEGDLRGTAGNANTVGDKSLQWILEQISAAKTGIVNGNLEQNGWVKFANGLIIQWLYNATPSANGIAFPITFSYKCFAVFSNRTNNTHSGDVCSTHVHSFTNSWVKVWSGKTDEAMNFGSYYKVNILAVGI